ncbi:MAG: rhodanese-like domain-containing protein [Candidatus Binataceae bacterium]|jgi:rhodanese-related sulfurtransferase
MAIRQIEPPQAYQMLSKNPQAVYLDVRTEGEFAQGHPEGAINIPVLFVKGPGVTEDNPDFLGVARKLLPQDKTLVVGCLSGGRSQRACEMLERAGYSDLSNVCGGFGGARDAGGRLVVTGWREAGLPVSDKVGDAGYQALRKKAGV